MHLPLLNLAVDCSIAQILKIDTIWTVERITALMKSGKRIMKYIFINV